MTLENTAAAVATVAPILEVRMRLPVSSAGPEKVSDCSEATVINEVLAAIVPGLAIVTASEVVERMEPPASVCVPVPNGPLVGAPAGPVELAVGMLVEPDASVVP